MVLLFILYCYYYTCTVPMCVTTFFEQYKGWLAFVMDTKNAALLKLGQCYVTIDIDGKPRTHARPLNINRGTGAS